MPREKYISPEKSLMYNLIAYSNIYLKTSESLWQGNTIEMNQI